jgi:tetratricopeptide (TPR) repeat protein
MSTRDEFKNTVVRNLANRSGNRCSNPDCRRETSGPAISTDKSINIGVAAHITAAAPGGPRFDSQLPPFQRSAGTNGIWLCQTCAKLIDSDVTQFTTSLLLEWKLSAERRAELRLQTPERPQSSDEPILVLPCTDPAVSWLPFSSQTTTLVGRDVEQAVLADFLNSDRRFLWWLLVGAAGSGKSRLALELALKSKHHWYSGFLRRADRFTGWSHFRPSRPTLIVVDYVASRAIEVSDMVLQLDQSNTYFPHPVRVLLIERDRGSWWPRFCRNESQSESAELIACQYDAPLKLLGLAPEAALALASEFAALRKISWEKAEIHAFERRMRTLDPTGRPLFGMIAAACLGNGANEETVDSSLLRMVLAKEMGRWQAAIVDPDRLRKTTNLLALSTLVGGLLPRLDSFAFLADSDIAAFIPDPNFVNGELAGATSNDQILAGLQPDILGERFILDQLAESHQYHVARRLVAAAWTIQPDGLCDFIVRASADFPGDNGLDELCDLPLDTREARARWGRMVGDLIRVANRSTDRRTRQLLGKLRSIGDANAGESELQETVASAEMSLGNVFLFSEREYVQAAAQFEAAITRAGDVSEAKSAAINNRGILYDLKADEQQAFADWTIVIASQGISDEARACSLNNRADVFTRRGDHEAAIRDRSEVLCLKTTSPDRRFIALIRRSRSYCKLKCLEKALIDLGSILISEDISPPQKCEARIERSAIYRGLGRLNDARKDLGAVLASEERFPGTLAETLVELGELSRLERQPDRSRSYLDLVSAEIGASEPTLVEALVVRAKLFVDEGNVSAADSMWQTVLANPNATARQKMIAENGGMAPEGGLL